MSPVRSAKMDKDTSPYLGSAAASDVIVMAAAV
jgi:hypothetical protein